MSRPLPARVQSATGGDTEAVREHILTAAYRVVARDGLAAASTRAIAEEAGLAGGTLYNYFGNRVGLVAAAIVHRARTITDPVADLPARAGIGTLAENLEYFADQASTVLGELVPLFAAAFSDTALLAEVRRRMAEVGMLSDPATAVEQYLVAERRLGRIAADADCRAAASIVVSMCHDDAFQSYLHGDGAGRRSRRREIELVVRSLTGSQPSRSGK
ncbi:TetR/AcrR family transcriptional regulator [Streptomyces sp. HUAS TT20]|uniref:TetR/AcrR family transcriptional regulator n=1 Tax=Streptomyces sp. HUAS TT20 TaxID=3447509 RepID=UPI0021D852A3|nr:TetR/AcrR family transcriptional regulator [Streptomyces sp. HUAS 15-9]UXY30241.1 TetR/AcrR family transcriptional regulator [Streptomyces sp. HUAS 15-9]